MPGEANANTVTLDIDVDTSGLQRALDRLDRIADSANAARAALVAFAATDVQCLPLSVDLVEGELRQDEMSTLILAELKALRADLIAQREICAAIQVTATLFESYLRTP